MAALDRAQLEQEWRAILARLEQYAREEPEATWVSLLNLVRLSQYLQPKREVEDQQALVESLGKLYAQVKRSGSYEQWRDDPRNEVAVALLYAQTGRVRGRLAEMRDRLRDAQQSLGEYMRLAAERSPVEGAETRRFDPGAR